MKQKIATQKDIARIGEAAINTALGEGISESAFKSMKRFAANIESLYVDFKVYHESLLKIDKSSNNLINYVDSKDRIAYSAGTIAIALEQGEKMGKRYMKENERHLKALQEMFKSYDALPEDFKEACFDELD